MNKVQALQAAQSDVRTNSKWQSPYYWVAFVLSGDVGESATEPARHLSSTPASTSDQSSPICLNSVMAPIAIIMVAFTTKRFPRSAK